MKTDFTNTLVIGVSSRALFDLEEENRIFETEHIQAYRKYLSEHEAEPLKVGTAFYLVKNLLTYLFFAGTASLPRWEKFYFSASKFYFVFSLVLMVLCHYLPYNLC